MTGYVAMRASCLRTQVYEPGSGISSTGALTAYSGAKTGRSPSDKRIVKEETSENEIWYGLSLRSSAFKTTSSQTK
jgi:ATP-dependent phosphoenolpyruvate carboxykinase